MRSRHILLTTACLWAASAGAVPFDITLTNTGTNTAYPWSTGLLTLAPLISLGLSPQPASPQYATYSYANSHCALSDAFCSGTCSDDGNAAVLVQRRGLTLGVDAWLVPALPAGRSATATVSIDVPAGSRLSYLAWINNTTVFDDFVAMHPAGDVNTLSVPLFDAAGQPLATVAFALGGYDTNSTSPTNGSGTTCAQECPAAATGCYVAPGNASVGFPGTYPAPPATSLGLRLTTAGPTAATNPQAVYTFSYSNPGTSTASAAVLSYTLPAGVSFVSTPGGTVSGSTVTWALGNLAPGAAGTRTATVNLGQPGPTLHWSSVSWTVGTRPFTVVSNAVTTVLAAQPLATTWVFTDPAGRATDGLAVGDFTNSTGLELVVLAPTRGASGPGRAVVLQSTTGAQLNEFSPGTGRNAMGLPLAEELSGGGRLEYLFGEPLPQASNSGLYARAGSSAGLWTSLPYGYAAFWNMGPSSANVLSGVAGNEVVLADWDGNVRLLRGSTGAVQASYNTWTTDRDHAFGHVALADVDGDGTLEATLAGTTQGTVMVLNADTLTMQWKSAPLKTLYGDSAYGSGPAVGDLDGDGRPELVVATRGTTSDVYAFDVAQPTGSTCKYRLDPGGSFTYTSPVLGDVDGSGSRSIVTVSSTDAVLSVMKPGAQGCAVAGGTMVWQHPIKVGERSAFTPLLYDVTGDGVLDVIAASTTRLEIIDVRRRVVVAYFEDPTAAFSPSGAIANADTGSAVRELYVSGWKNSKVYRLALPATAVSTTDWTTFMGGNARTGSR